MNDDDLNRILSQGEDIVPSSGFVPSVMERISLEVELPPLPFPWMRALPGIIVCLALAAIFVSYLPHLHSSAFFGWNFAIPYLATEMPDWLVDLKRAAIHWQAGWAALALAVSFFASKLSMRLGAWHE